MRKHLYVSGARNNMLPEHIGKRTALFHREGFIHTYIDFWGMIRGGRMGLVTIGREVVFRKDLYYLLDPPLHVVRRLHILG